MPTLDDTREGLTEFSLLGGPLHRVGVRLGLVRGRTNTMLLGVALGGGVWLTVAVLALIAGVADRMFSLSIIGFHARLLVVIPLFFVCESWVVPRMAGFVEGITASGVMPASAMPALNGEVAATRQRADAWWPDATCLLAAILLAITGATLQGYGAASAVFDPSRKALAAWVYYRVGLTLFRFLLFRWLWRMGLWCWFLWRVSRLDLHLVAGHPDRTGGLSAVAGVHERFTPLVAAISVLQCASLVEDLSVGRVGISGLYPTLALLLLLDATVFLGPLLVFTDKLLAGRTEGLRAYMGFAARYVTEFERKWLGNANVHPPDSMLGTPDLQSLADLANSVNVVGAMRWVPVGPRLLTQVTLAALLPLAPLLLFRYPAADLAEKFFARLIGL